MAHVPQEFQDLAQRGYRFALSLTHDAARAEDVLQDAWFSLLKRNGPWNRSYVFATIRNQFIDQYRRTAAFGAESLNEMGADAAGQGDGIDDALDEPMVIANGNLASALARLSSEERGLLYLSGVEHCSAQAIADMLQWPRGTVLGVIRRAKGKLRYALSNGTSDQT